MFLFVMKSKRNVSIYTKIYCEAQDYYKYMTIIFFHFLSKCVDFFFNACYIINTTLICKYIIMLLHNEKERRRLVLHNIWHINQYEQEVYSGII